MDKYVLYQPRQHGREYHILKLMNGRYFPFAVLTDFTEACWLVNELNEA